MKKIMLLVKVSRPVFWLLGPFVFLAGLYYGGYHIAFLPVLQLVMFSFPLCLFTFGINDVNDYYSDRINPRKNTIEGFILSPKHHKYVNTNAFAAAGVLIISSLFTLDLFNILSVMSLVILLYIYSAKPIRLKEKPPFDSLSNGLITLFVFLTGYSYSHPVYAISYKAYLVALCISGIHAYTTIIDYKYDRKAGINTFAVRFGKRVASLFAFFSVGITLLLAGFSLPVTAFFLLSAFAFLVTAIYPSEKLAGNLSRVLFAGFFIFASLYIYNYIKIFK